MASSTNERVAALLIRVRVAPPQDSCALMIRVAGRTDVQVDEQETLVFGTETDALAWVARWLHRAADCQPG
jgi:hypothetical protein